MLKAEEIIHLLGLKPLPEEGGYYSESYRSDLTLPSRILSSEYSGNRKASTAIYYLLTPETFSAVHLLPGDEIFHFYLGDPVEMLQLHPDGTGHIVRMGSDLSLGFRPQVLVPGGSWQGSRLIPGGQVVLMGTTMAPGFEFSDYKKAVRSELTSKYPDFAEMISALTRQ